ncbi:MAG: hypothetical protein QOJ27_301 [Sphingomonadales bacterium]|nr:hypothetical protein [Sphingomonadales bacterium]
MGSRQIVTVAALAIGIGVFGAGPAFADEGSGNSQPGKAMTETSRKICRILIPTGSRMTTRICRTQAEWAKSMDKAQESMLRYQSTQQSGYAH